MAKSPTARATVPHTVWLARGRHLGSAAEDTVRRHLRRLQEHGTVDDHLAPDDTGSPEPPVERAFEARWRVTGAVTVRARLALRPLLAPERRREERGREELGHGESEWVLVAEAEQPWDPRWPSPTAMFWPEEDPAWDHDAVAGLRHKEINRLPEDDKVVRRLLKDCARDSWSIHVVVHEAMTPDERGLRPLARLLPPGLVHRVVEHRAAPDQFRAVNWALRDHGVQLPRGGALILPGAGGPKDRGEEDITVRTVFLDGSEPAELLVRLARFAVLPRPFPPGAAEALTVLREQWHLMSLEEKLARANALIEMYAEALEAMTKSRDLYREAAERAQEALAAYREAAPGLDPGAPGRERGGRGPGFSLQRLTRAFDRVRDGARPQASADAPLPAQRELQGRPHVADEPREGVPDLGQERARD